MCWAVFPDGEYAVGGDEYCLYDDNSDIPLEPGHYRRSDFLQYPVRPNLYFRLYCREQKSVHELLKRQTLLEQTHLSDI